MVLKKWKRGFPKRLLNKKKVALGCGLIVFYFLFRLILFIGKIKYRPLKREYAPLKKVFPQIFYIKSR